MSDIDWSQFKKGDDVEFAYDDGTLRIEKGIGTLSFDTEDGDSYVYLITENASWGLPVPQSGFTSITKAEPPIIDGDAAWFEDTLWSVYDDKQSGLQVWAVSVGGRHRPLSEIPPDALWLVRNGTPATP